MNGYRWMSAGGMMGPSSTLHKAEGAYCLGLLYQMKGNMPEAIRSYEKSLIWESGSADVFEARGDAYADLGDSAKAQADYDAAAKLAKDTPEGLIDRCWWRTMRGHPLDRALADCNAGLSGVVDEIDAHDKRCFVYFRMQDYKAAIDDCDWAIARNPRLPDALYIRGLAKLRSGDAEGGNADIASAEESDRRISETYAIYGVNK